MYYGYIGNAHANMQSSVISIFTPPCPTKDEAERAFDVYFNGLPKQLKIEAYGREQGVCNIPGEQIVIPNQKYSVSVLLD